MGKQSKSETDNGKTKTVTEGAGKTQASPNNPTIEDLQAQLSSAEKRISELNHESQTRRESLEAYEAAEQERQEAELSAQDRLKNREAELQEAQSALDTTSEQLDQINQVLEDQYKATVKALNIPDLVQDAIKDKPAAERLAYINNHRDEFSSAFGVDLGAGKSGKSRKVASIKDLEGMSADEINEVWDDLLAQG